MSKTVTVEELRENLEDVLSDAKAGEEISITLDGKEIARITGPTILRRGVPYPFRDLKITPLSKPLGVDPVEELIAEREHERSGKKYGL